MRRGRNRGGFAGAETRGELMFPLARSGWNACAGERRGDRAAQEALWKTLRVVTEPGGAAAFAGARRAGFGKRVGVVVCGGNTTAVDFGRA